MDPMFFFFEDGFPSGPKNPNPFLELRVPMPSQKNKNATVESWILRTYKRIPYKGIMLKVVASTKGKIWWFKNQPSNHCAWILKG